jgi:hypothetical protein
MPRFFKYSSADSPGNVGVVKLDDGKIATYVEGETCACCASDGPTCITCAGLVDGDGNPLPDVVCPAKPGMSASAAGVNKITGPRDEFFDAEGTFFTLEWLPDTVPPPCLHARGYSPTLGYGCTNLWTSNAPVAQAIAIIGEDLYGPDDGPAPRMLVNFYLSVTFDCGDFDYDGSGTPTGLGTMVPEIIGDQLDLVLFPAGWREAPDPFVHAAWDRSCSRSGQVGQNPFTSEDAQYANRPDGKACGYGGTVTVGGGCNVGDCGNCAPSAVVVSVDTAGPYEDGGGVPFHRSYTLNKVADTASNRCRYSGTGTNEAGVAVVVTLTFDYDLDMHVVSMTRVPGWTGPAGTTPGAGKRCNGTTSSLTGTYPVTGLVIDPSDNYFKPYVIITVSA